MNNLVTFFAKSKDGVTLVGIGLTDKMIDHIKERTMVLQEATRNGMATDVTIVYAPTDTELIVKLKDLLPADQTEVHVL